MVDEIGKPFNENYKLSSNSLFEISPKEKALHTALEDIKLVLKIQSFNIKDKLKLVHELAEQALKEKDSSILLSIHSLYQL